MPVTKDASALRRAEDSLRESEERFHVENINLGQINNTSFMLVYY